MEKTDGKPSDSETIQIDDFYFDVDEPYQQHLNGQAVEPYVEAYPLSQEQFRQLEFQNDILAQKITQAQNEAYFLKEALDKTRAHSSSLEKQNEDLQKRLDDAISTLFKLRPQRQDCTETEIEQDYKFLKSSIEAWVEKNCGTFLDNESYSCNMIRMEKSERRSYEVYQYESKMKNYFTQRKRLNDGKDLVLIAILMKYICNCIFDASFDPWLSRENATLLRNLEENMDAVGARQDIKTRRNWRSETAFAIFNCNNFHRQQTDNVIALVEDIFSIVCGLLPEFGDESSRNKFLESINLELVQPALLIAQKILCSPSHWEFRYSVYESILPGRQAYSLPEFADALDQYRFINFSAHRKQLKPPIDLATREQKSNLLYLLDVFPGLYCSRLEDDHYLPRMTIESPELLVAFNRPTAYPRR